MKVTFPGTQCDVVQTEILARIAGQSGWTDPHNGGKYVLTSSDSDDVHGTRAPGSQAKQPVPDKFGMSLSQDGADCTLQACSESQVFSILDFSTNYCNLHDLYCGSADKCPFVKSDLKGYTEDFTSCHQNTKSKCTPGKDAAVDQPGVVEKMLDLIHV